MNQSETEIETAEKTRGKPSAIRGNRARSSAARRAGDPAAPLRATMPREVAARRKAGTCAEAVRRRASAGQG